MSNSVILLAILGYLGAMFKNNITKILNYIVKLNSSSIRVDDNNYDLYVNAINYINSLNNKIIKNNVMLRFRYKRDSDELDVIRAINPSTFTVKLSSLTFMIISFNIDKLLDRQLNIINITIIGKNHQIYKEKIIDYISKISDNNIYISNLRSKRTEVPKKSFDDLFIYGKDVILNSINIWIESREFYEKHNINYKFGILLHGNPGTGKTSCILALANYLNYNILVVDSTSITTQYDFLMNNISPNTIIVFEDIDCLFGNISRKNDESTQTDDNLNKLLQLLDGVNSPSNVVFILTTNHKDRLDDALYRPGRINLDIQLSNINKDLALEMINRFEQPESLLDGEEFPINPAYLQAKIIDNINKYCKVTNE